MDVIFEETVMYRDSLKAIEAKAEEITDKVLAEILARAEGGYYSSAPEEAVSDRISQVIGDVQKRLESWLGRNEPKNLIFDRYLHLGAKRCKQCMPVEEIAAALLMIQREISCAVSARTAADHANTHDEPAYIIYYVNLIFAGIIQSVITGYWNEQTVIARKRRWEKLLPKGALRI
jgi:hypothetical protein